MQQREKIVHQAYGRVLEVGLGSGLNLPYYAAKNVSKLWGIDSSAVMIEMAQSRARSLNFEVEFINRPAEDIPLETNSIDTVLVTYTICTIVDVNKAIREMARVLKPDGRLLFCEHGVAPDLAVHRLQNCINPVWKRLGGGCHINRDIPKLIEQGGFIIEELKSMYITGWRPASYNYWGRAKLQTIF
jgi:ubiquinone/menaquinone biosynthesis C-methylase UbiE